jgi:UDP-N-acetylmuramoylalanine--D-glutamate ligase
LEGKHRDRPLLDSVDYFRLAGFGDTETEVNKLRYKGQNIAVLGAGLSGTAAALLLKAEGAQVTMLDSAEEKNLLKSTIDNLRKEGIRVICGKAADDDSSAYQMAVLSPGVDPASPLACNFSARRIDMIGELELGWRFCEAPVIAVTGTNGKTTTTELLAEMLNACGQLTIACGNIGKPLSEVARERKHFDVLTVEVSSFQLETIQSFHPSISLWLNFAPDHLDRYRSVGDYHAAKLRIFENQTEQDVAVVNAVEALPKIRPRRITFSAYADQADFRLSNGTILYRDQAVLRLSDTKLCGLHNIENLMATLAAGVARGLSFAEMVPPLRNYEPRPHRCEFVREVDGVEYVNDSKATNLDAVEKALRAQTKPVVLIAGGKDKGFTFDPLRSLVQEKARSTILIGEMAERISRSWSGAANSEIANSLADAVERAHAMAKPGDIVLFSPGTSSFDMFKSYADRGDQFRTLVQALPPLDQ